MISVVIPTKDRPESLRRAVASIFRSAPEAESIEIIVVNDGAAACELDVDSNLGAIKLKVVQNSLSAGPAGARNCGVAKSCGETIFFLDDDDEMLPGYINSILRMRQQDSALAKYGFSAIQRNGANSAELGPTGLLTPETPLRKKLGGLGMGFWITRDSFEDVGPIDEELSVNEDTEFCVRLAAKGYYGWYSSVPGVKINQAFIEKGELRSITSRTDLSVRTTAFEKILSKHSCFLEKHPEVRSNMVERIVKYRARQGEFKGAMTFARDNRMWMHQAALIASINFVRGKKTRLVEAH